MQTGEEATTTWGKHWVSCCFEITSQLQATMRIKCRICPRIRDSSLSKVNSSGVIDAPVVIHHMHHTRRGIYTVVVAVSEGLG
jgi:hypothetical protein